MLKAPSARALIVLAILGALFLVLPGFVGAYGLKFATRLIILSIFVVSLDFLLGLAGLVSFGHAAFFGAGFRAAGRSAGGGLSITLRGGLRLRSPCPRTGRNGKDGQQKNESKPGSWLAAHGRRRPHVSNIARKRRRPRLSTVES
mgnify:CR=1 FL=1